MTKGADSKVELSTIVSALFHFESARKRCRKMKINSDLFVK